MLPYRVPLGEQEASRLYWELSRLGAFCTGKRYPWRDTGLSLEKLLCLALAQSRYDPRLLVILVDFFRKENPALDPILFKRELRQADLLAVMAVVCEWAFEQGVTASVRERFDYWRTGVTPIPTQLFYRGLYPIGGHKMTEAVNHSPWAFKKWGFLAADAPLLKERASSGRVYLYDGPGRIQILREMTQEQRRFRLKDYLKRLHFSVSRQQALQDLKALPWIHQQGKGKGTYYSDASSAIDFLAIADINNHHNKE